MLHAELSGYSIFCLLFIKPIFNTLQYITYGVKLILIHLQIVKYILVLCQSVLVTKYIKCIDHRFTSIHTNTKTDSIYNLSERFFVFSLLIVNGPRFREDRLDPIRLVSHSREGGNPVGLFSLPQK